MKKKQILSLILAAVMIVGLLPSFSLQVLAADSNPWTSYAQAFDASSGKGSTAANPIIIDSAEKLAYLAQQVNNGNNYADKFFKQTVDIDIGAHQWVPIGKDSNFSFSGFYDGNRKSINNLTIVDPSMANIGLFGYINSSTSNYAISNLTLNSVSITGKSTTSSETTDASSLASYVYGNIINCNSNGTISLKKAAGSTINAGGLFATISCGTVSLCFTSVNISCESNSSSTWGNVCTSGFADSVFNANILNCYSTGDVSSSSYHWQVRAAGFITYASGSTISNCYSLGYVSPTLIRNFNDQTSTTTYIGGFISFIALTTTVSNCYSASGVRVMTSTRMTDGIEGYNGRLIGYIGGTGNATFTNCFYNTNGIYTVIADYFFSDIGGRAVTGTYTGTPTGLTSANLQNNKDTLNAWVSSPTVSAPSGFSYARWDRNIDEYSGYPYLLFTTPITATLTAPASLSYNGTAKTYTANISGGTPALGTDYNITYTSTGGYNSTTAPTNAGTYTATFGLTTTGAQTYTIESPPSVNFTITKAEPTWVSLSASPTSPTTYPQTVTLSSTVSSGSTVPTGTVTFYNGSSVIGTGTLNAGTATCSWTPNADAYTNIYATYNGDGNFNAKTSSSISYTVNKANPSTSDLTYNFSAPVAYKGSAQAVSVTSGKTGFGTITVYYNGSTTVPTNAGTYTITVDVKSGTNYNDVTGLNLGNYTISKVTPTISGSASFSKTYGDSSFNLGASTNNTDSSALSYSVVSGTSVTVNSSGIVTLVGLGTTTINVSAVETTNFNAPTVKSITVTVNKATPIVSLSSNINPSIYEGSVIFTATVNKVGIGVIPTGTVQFKNGASNLGTPVALDSSGIAKYSTSALNAGPNTITAVYNADSNYNTSTSTALSQVVNQKPVVLTITGQEQVYDGTSKIISIDETGTRLNKSDFSIKYYLVNENEDVLSSTTPVTKAVSPAKYLYVIDFAGTQPNYKIQNKFVVSNTTLPIISNYDNVGYMTIKSQTAQQKPIYFGEGIVNKLVGNSIFTNPLTNANASTVTYSSTNTNVATVNSATGEVTVLKDGSTTIMAKSTLSGTADVFASYSLVVTKKQVTIKAENKTHTFGTPWDTSNGSVTYSDGLPASDFSGTLTYTTNYTNGGKVGEYKITPSGLTSDKYSIVYESATLTVIPKTLTKGDFNVTASDKFYDGTNKATLNVNIISGLYSTHSVKTEIEGTYTSVNATDNAIINYKITGLTGRDADNYVLDGGNITGTVAAKIEKAKVSIICASTTTKTYDGNAQTVDISAMANGNIFDSSSYTIKYDGKDSASSVGTYPVTVVLNDDVKNNYSINPFTATLTIKEGVQDVFSIENVPDRVYYGDKFKVTTQGANGTVTYSLNQYATATIDTEGNVAIAGTGTVTITATSIKEGYTPKTSTRTFTVYQRVLMPTATATDRVYNAQNGVDVTISLENLLATDNVTATGSGVMANADAGTDKIVYVTGIKLEGSNKDFYTLSNTTLQTSVNINKATVTGFTILADSKKYDGTNDATATVDSINGIFDSDKGQVNVIGSAVFNDELSDTGKTVTFTANGLTGAKAENYKFANDSAKTATKTADITPINVNFTVGTVTFKYDGDEKEVAVSGVDEFGRVFSDYTVQYFKDNILLSELPSEAGDYTVKIVLNDNANYTTTKQDISMIIAQASQEQITIVGLPGAIEYTDEFTLEAIGGSGTGYVEWASDNSNVTVDSDGNVSIDGAVNEKVTITATKKDDTNYTEKSAKVVFIPTAKTISFTLGDLSQTYDENDKQISITPSIGNATYDVTYNGLSDLPVNAGTYNVVVTANGNYKGTANTTLTIGKANMSGLSVSQDGCTYGDALVDATFDTAPKGVDVSVKYSTLDGKKPTKAGDYIVTATYTGDNYETFVASSEFKIEKKILTVKANDKTRKYGEANPVFTLIYDGFVNNEDASILLSEPIATTAATASSPVNDYEISVSGGRADNYSFNYDNAGKLSVTGASGGNFYITGSNNSVIVGDIFTLHAYYDNAQPKVKWVSSDSTVISVDENGSVKILKKGDATITATITDTNYESGISATFKLNAQKKALALKPADLVKVYNTQRQDITLVSDDESFIPKLSGVDKNIDIAYTLTTNSSVTEPKQAGVYTVTYSINHPSYTGGDTVTMYINKANVTVTAHDLTKVYGEANPAYYITGLIGTDETDANYIAKIAGIFNITSDADATGTKTNVGEYPITLALKEGKSLNDDTNYNLAISDDKGSLTVTKAPLKIKVSDAQRAYSEDNKNPEYEYVGFVNGETEADLTNKPAFTYDASIRKETNVGTYPDTITASGAASGNYEISYSYADGNKANLTITSLPVRLSAGTSKTSNLTVNLDKAIAGLTKNNFKVTLNGVTVEIISVTANRKNTVYTLNGKFKANTTYVVEVKAFNYLFEGSPISITPAASSSGGGGGGGNLVTDTYKITVTQATGGKISPETVSVNKNGSKTFTIAPNEGYEIEEVLVNGKSVGKVNEYTFEKITSAGTITAKFKKVEPEKPVDPVDQIQPEWKNPFSDVNEKDWFYEAVKFVNEKGFMMGTTSSAFEPKGDVTRAMFVTVLYRIENEPDANTALFNDLEDGAYYEKAVAWASENGIVKGISETQFAPNKGITREQMAVIVYRYAMFKGVDISVSDKTDYTDNASISNYAKDAVAWASNNGIMTGNTNGSFVPQDNSKRAEIAVVLQRFIEMILNNK